MATQPQASPSSTISNPLAASAATATFLALPSEILNENLSGDSYTDSKRMSPSNCRAYARTHAACTGCGKEIHIHRLRCRNVYLCDNCGGASIWAWRWFQERDVATLEHWDHTGIELSIPVNLSLSLSARESLLLTMYNRFIDELNVAQVRMPIVDPSSTATSLRAALAGIQDFHKMTRLWKTLTGGKGWLSMRRYRPTVDRMEEFFEWVFSGLTPLKSQPAAVREAVEREFVNSQRVSATRNSLYSPLPKAEQKRRREEHRILHSLHLCGCCGENVKPIPHERQEVALIEDLRDNHPDTKIIEDDEYNPFEYARRHGCHQEIVSRRAIRNFGRLKVKMATAKTGPPPL